jgi:hypothetical protein
MQPLNIQFDTIDFNQAHALAQANADVLLGDNMGLSWYDQDRDLESPRNASECHAHCATPAYIDYANYRGAELMVNINNGRFVFCFKQL